MAVPIWSEILNELKQSQTIKGKPDFDGIRRKYLVQAHQITQRNVILYSAKCTQPDQNVSSDLISIIDEDIQGMMEVTHGLTGSKLDLILHSTGGSPEAAEAIVTYLRSRFRHIRVIVPQIAMSAATMIACAANKIVMGKHSFLGPIDPQLFIPTSLGTRMVAAEAILEQFEKAKTECHDPAKMGAWLPMLAQYGPDLLVRCENVCEMSRTVVKNWLENYMFGRRSDAKSKAQKAAKWLSNHKYFKSHGRHISRPEAKKYLYVDNLESNKEAQDNFLSVFHATTHTFGATAAVKIIENHLGKAFVKTAQPMIIPVRQPPGPTKPEEAPPEKV